MLSCKANVTNSIRLDITVTFFHPMAASFSKKQPLIYKMCYLCLRTFVTYVSSPYREQGGGISIFSLFDSTVNVSISKTEIGNNLAGTFGGGIAFSGDGNINSFTVIDSIEKAVENNIIHHNIAFGTPNGGGGVAAITTDDDSDYDIKFVNNTISDNQAPTTGAMGGGILADSNAETMMGTINWTLPNDIIFFNSSAGTGDQVILMPTGANATIVLRFTDVSNA